MVITTSFKQADKYTGRKYSIANSQPPPGIYPVKIHLRPPWSTVCGYKNGHLTEADFILRYTQQLNNFSALVMRDIYRDMKRAIDDNVIYLCWEPAGQFCHRNILAAWLAGQYPDVTFLAD